LTPEHKQKFDEIKALFEVSKPSLKSISSGLLRGPATTASGGMGYHPNMLSMEWIYLSHRKSAPELCAKKSTT
jgi:hypothetical protein